MPLTYRCREDQHSPSYVLNSFPQIVFPVCENLIIPLSLLLSFASAPPYRRRQGQLQRQVRAVAGAAQRRAQPPVAQPVHLGGQAAGGRRGGAARPLGPGGQGGGVAVGVVGPGVRWGVGGGGGGEGALPCRRHGTCRMHGGAHGVDGVHAQGGVRHLRGVHMIGKRKASARACGCSRSPMLDVLRNMCV